MRGISVGPESIHARVEGINEMDGRVPKLRRIHVHYDLTVPAGSREKVDRALATHVEKCPTASSLLGAIDVTWTADIVEK